MNAIEIAKKYVNANPHITSNRDKVAIDIAILMTAYAQEHIADARKTIKLPNLTEQAKKLKEKLLDEKAERVAAIINNNEVPTLARYEHYLPENLV